MKESNSIDFDKVTFETLPDEDFQLDFILQTPAILLPIGQPPRYRVTAYERMGGGMVRKYEFELVTLAAPITVTLERENIPFARDN